MTWMRALVSSSGLGLLLVSLSCQAPRGPAEVKSTDPDLKIVAIEHDVCEKRVADVPQMVVDLESDDAAVRFYSIEGLRRLTGDDFGYRYYDPEEVRAPALARWQNWLNRGGYSRLKRAD